MSDPNDTTLQAGDSTIAIVAKLSAQNSLLKAQVAEAPDFVIYDLISEARGHVSRDQIDVDAVWCRLIELIHADVHPCWPLMRDYAVTYKVLTVVKGTVRATSPEQAQELVESDPPRTTIQHSILDGAHIDDQWPESIEIALP